jgi:hypothetical protein
MKQTKYTKVALLALACAFAVGAAPKAEAVSYTDGDLFLGFRATSGTGSTITYLINIGQGSIYRDATSTFNLSIGDIGQDLSDTFGTWTSNANLKWGVFGAYALDTNGNDTNTLYASKAESPVGTVGVSWNRRSDSAQAGSQAKVQNLVLGYLGDPEGSTANSNFGVLMNTSQSNDWSEFMPGGGQSTASTAFAVYSTAFEGNFGNGTAGTRLDLFQLKSGATTAGTYEGTFAINDAGQVSFQVVPEPASAAMLGLGTVMLGFVRRRQKATV